LDLKLLAEFIRDYGYPLTFMSIVVFAYQRLVDKIMKDNDKREKRYLDTIKNLTLRLGVVDYIKDAIDEFKIDLQYLKEKVDENE
jgi:hypothetical protein